MFNKISLNSVRGEGNPTYLIAGSIIVAGVIIAGAVVYSGNAPEPAADQLGQARETLGDSDSAAVTLRGVDETDHVFGDPNAPLKLIEFSDLECPYCKTFHFTITESILEDYINSGRVAWVFRHNPLSIHRKARTEALAAECVAELGGNESFWKFIDRVYQVTPSNDGLDLNQLPVLAGEVGVSSADFNACLDSGRHNDRITAHMNEALEAGAQGTPYAVVVNERGEHFIIPGALPATQIKSILDRALAL